MQDSSQTKKTIVFVSDIHILPKDDAGADRFLSFLDSIKTGLTRLYILGDLFDHWVGAGHENDFTYRKVLLKIHELVDAGIPVHVLFGNRDFLLGRGFVESSGAILEGDEARLTIDDKTVHLSHGDVFVERDRGYMRIRRVLRSSLFRLIYSSLPYRLRLSLARWLRRQSKRKAPLKSPRMVEVSLKAIDRLFADGVDVVICGHTHRQAKLESVMDGRQWMLLNLGEWSGDGSYLRYENGTFTFCKME